MRAERLTPHLRAALHGPLADLARQAVYPLGDDAYAIDPGADYFAFAERLGEPCHVAIRDGDRLAAAGTGVLRALPVRQGEAARKVWQLLDLQVAPDYRGRRLGLQLLAKGGLPLNYARAPRAYAVLPASHEAAHPVETMLKGLRWAPFEAGPELAIYALEAATVADLTPMLTQFRGHLGFLSLAGVRDRVMRSTGEPLPLVHVTWDAMGNGVAPSNRKAPVPGATHMLCAPATDPLAIALAARGIAPVTTASIIHHRMPKSDWRFVLTSDF